MPDDIEFRHDLFHGTADYYDRFRLGYPQPMLDDILGRVGLNGRGRLLDLACGTGQIAFALADAFAEVWAVDQEPDMISLVRDKAVAAGAGHVRPVVSAVRPAADHRLRLRAVPATDQRSHDRLASELSLRRTLAGDRSRVGQGDPVRLPRNRTS